MEKTVNSRILWISLSILITNVSLGQSNPTVIDNFTNNCGSTKVNHYYSVEEPDDKKYTFSPVEMKINTDLLNLHFYSEVNDDFKIYVNGSLHSDILVNTKLESGGRTRLVKIDFPNGTDKFTLRLVSTKYGCFETEVRKQHPLLYIKYLSNTWHLDHNTVFELPQMYFMNDN